MPRFKLPYTVSRGSLVVMAIALVFAAREYIAPARLVIPVRYEKPGTAQLFYDVGHGIRAEDVATVATTPRQREISFPLPRGALRALRFDPMSGPGRFAVGAARYETGGGRRLHIIQLEQIEAQHQVIVAGRDSDYVTFTTTPGANDPMINLRLPASLPSARPRPWLALLVAIASGALFWRTYRLGRETDAAIGRRLGGLAKSVTLPVGVAAFLIAALQLALAWPLHRTLDLPTYDEVNYAARGAHWSGGPLGQFHNSPLYAIGYWVVTRFIPDLAVAIYAQHYLLKILLSTLLFMLLRKWWGQTLPALGVTFAWILTAYNTEQPYLVYHAGLLIFTAGLVCADRMPIIGVLLAVLAGCVRQEYLTSAVVLAAFALVGVLRRRWTWSHLTSRDDADRKLAIVMTVALALTVALVASRTTFGGSSARAWYAFQQHYAYRASLRGELPPGTNPWVDYDQLIGRQFPGATSVVSAWRTHSAAATRHVGANIKDASREFLGLWRPFGAIPRWVMVSLALAIILGLSRAVRVSPRPPRSVPVFSSCLAIGGLFAVVPGLLVSARDAYLLPAVPAALLAGGILLRRFWSLVPNRITGWARPMAAVIMSAALLGIFRAWPIQQEGSRQRVVADTVAELRRLWPAGPPRVLLGVEATSYAHYLGPEICRGVELLDTAYGRANEATTLTDRIARVRAEAVIVTAQWRGSSRFEPRELDALVTNLGWSRVEVPAGPLYLRSPRRD